ncbi:MAG: YitT family protein [bacterium]|nr:YitT family protein [bacterium]
MNVSHSHKIPPLLTDIACDIAGSILYAISICTFAKYADFAPGGISGLALIIYHLCGFPIGLTSLLCNIPLILISYRTLGKQFLLKSARTMLISTFFIDLVFPHVPPYEGDPFLAALYSGALLGAGLALIYMRGSSTGGTDFLTLTVKAKRPHLSMGIVTMTIDLVIILLGWPVFGKIDSVLYGLAAAFVASTAMDKIMYGMGAGKLAIIITTHGAEIAETIAAICGRGSTSIPAIGTYTKLAREVLLCACSKAQAYKVRSAAHMIDPDAFVMIVETSEVFGEGFLEETRHP